MSGLKSVKKSKGLTKNSTIECTVDDLQEGLVVVSFTHQDRLFQGVLLQLNRERGIPAGISFPKDFFSGEKLTESHEDQSPAPPLNQRNTYFQEIRNGNPHRSLRRIIKPPARFKNSRMSLRPVNRPILCAKCGDRCEDKSVIEVDKDNEVSKPKRNGTNGITSKKNQTKATKSETITAVPVPISKNPESEASIPSLIEDPNDYNYVSVGSSGIIENGWKRPLSKPLKIQSKGSNTKSNSSEESIKTEVTTSGEGSPPLPLLVPNLFVSSKGVSSTCDRNPLLHYSFGKVFDNSPSKQSDFIDNDDSSLSPPQLFRISTPPLEFPPKLSNESKKANNLKLCLSKIAIGKRKIENKESNIIPNHPSTTLGFTLAKDTLKAPTSLSNSIVKKPRSRKRIGKTPLRFRDLNYPCNTNSNTNLVSESSSSINQTIESHQEQSNCRKFSKRQLDEENCRNNHVETISSSSGCPDSLQDKRVPLSISSDTRKKSQVNLNSNPIEPIKTPVIKITFGSFGNGVVVQIPPKTTLSPDDIESKAARKAMKRAKKEARKKHLSEPYSSTNALYPMALETNGPLDSYVPPIQFEKSIREQLTSRLSMSLELTVDDSVVHTSKKRKKEKKKRKGKHIVSPGTSNEISSSSPTLVENDEPVSSSSLTTIGTPIHKYTLQESPTEEKDFHEFENRQMNDAHQRVCISLKRVNTNAYIPFNNTFSIQELKDLQESTDNAEPCDIPIKETSNQDCLTASLTDYCPEKPWESLDVYYHQETGYTFHTGDVIWGKSVDLMWWPGKILEIFKDSKEVRAKIKWYKVNSQYISTFEELCPFDDEFEDKYAKDRSFGDYQQAVQEAFKEVHHSEDFEFD